MDNGTKILFSFIIIAALMLTLENPAQAAISGATLKTNLSTNVTANLYGGIDSTDRCRISANCTVNISFTESMPTNYTNITFPSGFDIGSATTGLTLKDITNNTGEATNMNRSTTIVNITYAAKDAGVLWFNFTLNVTAPATSGAYGITITTNATTSPTTVYLCARDPAYPFFVSANNTAFTTTCATNTETFSTTTTSMSLNGSAVANLTFFAPNVTTQANMTVGYGATNASVVMAAYTSGTSPNNTVHVTTDNSVTNPIITVSNTKDLQSKNWPAAVTGTAGAAVLVAVILYKIKRRTR